MTQPSLAHGGRRVSSPLRIKCRLSGDKPRAAPGAELTIAIAEALVGIGRPRRRARRQADPRVAARVVDGDGGNCGSAKPPTATLTERCPKPSSV